jgi:hypothetical protein
VPIVKVSQTKEWTLTRKHFELIAKIVKNIEDPMTRRNVAVDFAHALRGENPNFDICRFVKACDCSAPADGDKVTF